MNTDDIEDFGCEFLIQNIGKIRSNLDEIRTHVGRCADCKQTLVEEFFDDFKKFKNGGLSKYYDGSGDFVFDWDAVPESDSPEEFLTNWYLMLSRKNEQYEHFIFRSCNFLQDRESLVLLKLLFSRQHWVLTKTNYPPTLKRSFLEHLERQYNRLESILGKETFVYLLGAPKEEIMEGWNKNFQ